MKNKKPGEVTEGDIFCFAAFLVTEKSIYSKTPFFIKDTGEYRRVTLKITIVKW
jgi:hypothetical protein